MRPRLPSIVLLASTTSCTIIDRTPPPDAVYSEGCGQIHDADPGLVAHTLEVAGEVIAHDWPAFAAASLWAALGS